MHTSLPTSGHLHDFDATNKFQSVNTQESHLSHCTISVDEICEF